ncbi:MAG: hypothetical protein OP8BY_2433 [Candidatus Saccharicenans subterraneus]|uniref:Uncharacterized protein n=1 Tax=Candidatus Saccharicenans subterraneus TaxID=2508984 RepID=A0A3E2BJ39_9BACT|nr:MAG: hypothetical protein OP8BY_2433 [Candidatus Saccharicenans subterraneum]
MSDYFNSSSTYFFYRILIIISTNFIKKEGTDEKAGHH